jgi:hypothetical protein
MCTATTVAIHFIRRIPSASRVAIHSEAERGQNCSHTSSAGRIEGGPAVKVANPERLHLVALSISRSFSSRYCTTIISPLCSLFLFRFIFVARKQQVGHDRRGHDPVDRTRQDPRNGIRITLHGHLAFSTGIFGQQTK